MVLLDSLGYCTLRAKSSTTKEVWLMESSVPVR
jgi:hypothetical protein